MENQNYEQNSGYTGDPFAEINYGLCKKCGCRKIDRSEDLNSVLCKECREKEKKAKILPVICVVGVLVLAIIAIILVLAFGGLKNNTTQDIVEETADEKILDEEMSNEEILDEGYIITAMDNLLDILEEDPDNMEAAMDLVDIAMEYSYYDYASYTFNQYLADKEVSDKKYRKIVGYVDKLNIYYDTCDLSDEIWEQVYEDIGEDGDVYEILDEYSQILSEYIGNNNYDQALIYYYLGYMAVEDEKRLEYLTECVSINPCYFEAQAQIATYYRRQGDLEKARQILEETYAVNKEDYAVLRSYATLELVEGNLEKGLDFAYRAYEAYEDGEYVIDTYIVALAANDELEKARELVSEYENRDYIFDDDLYEFLDGNMTLEDYYIGE